MWRTISALVLLMTPANSSWAQHAGDYPVSSTKQPAPAPVKLPEPAIDPMGTGTGLDSDVSIGGRAPDFNLDGSQGGTVRLADLKGQWAVLVFSETRSVLAPLREIDDPVRKLGGRLYGICRDAVPTLKNYAERERIPFVLLSDLTRQASQVYGMYDSDSGSIQPGLVIIDPKGIVRMTVLGPALHADDVLKLVQHTLTGA